MEKVEVTFKDGTTGKVFKHEAQKAKKEGRLKEEKKAPETKENKTVKQTKAK
jgi:major membrane immunogen (membrane-anchored lipoprotein)